MKIVSSAFMMIVLWIFCQVKEKSKEKDKNFIIKDRKKRKKYIVKDKKEKSKMQNELFIAFMVGWAAAICFTIIGGFIGYFFSCMTGKTATNFDIQISPAFLSEIARSKSS